MEPEVPAEPEPAKKKVSLTFAPGRQLPVPNVAPTNEETNEKTAAATTTRDASISPPPTTDHFLTIVPKPTLLGKLQAKKRLQAFGLNKSPVKREVLAAKTEDSTKPQPSPTTPSEERKPKKVKPDDRAKNIIEEIEMIKKHEISITEMAVRNHKLYMARASRSPRDKRSKDRRDYHSRSSSDRRGKKRERDRKREKTPTSWSEFLSRNLSLERREDKKVPDSKCQDFAKTMRFPTPSVPMVSMRCKKANGQDDLVPGHLLRYTTKSPKICYSANYSRVKSLYLNRATIYSNVSREQKEAFKAIVEQSGQNKPILPKSPLHERKWYPKAVLSTLEPQCEILEPSLGLSILQNYSDDEERQHEAEVAVPEPMEEETLPEDKEKKEEPKEEPEVPVENFDVAIAKPSKKLKKKEKKQKRKVEKKKKKRKEKKRKKKKKRRPSTSSSSSEPEETVNVVEEPQKKLSSISLVEETKSIVDLDELTIKREVELEEEIYLTPEIKIEHPEINNTGELHDTSKKAKEVKTVKERRTSKDKTSKRKSKSDGSSKSRHKEKPNKQSPSFVDAVGVRTPDTDEYHSHWESDDGLTPVQKCNKNNSWESDDEVTTGNYTSPTPKSRQSERSLEMPLNISFARTRNLSPKRHGRRFDEEPQQNKPNWERNDFLGFSTSLEIKALEESRRNISEERRRIELERRKVNEEIAQTRLAESFMEVRVKVEPGLEPCETKRRSRKSRWEDTDLSEVVIKKEKIDEEVESSLPEATAEVEADKSVLEDEYEQFMKAVSSNSNEAVQETPRPRKESTSSGSTNSSRSSSSSSVSSSASAKIALVGSEEVPLPVPVPTPAPEFPVVYTKSVDVEVDSTSSPVKPVESSDGIDLENRKLLSNIVIAKKTSILVDNSVFEDSDEEEPRPKAPSPRLDAQLPLPVAAVVEKPRSPSPIRKPRSPSPLPSFKRSPSRDSFRRDSSPKRRRRSRSPRRGWYSPHRYSPSRRRRDSSPRRNRRSRDCSPRPGRDRSPHLSRDRSPRLSRDRSPHLSRDRSPRLSRDRSPRLSRDRSPRLSRDRSPNLSRDRSPRLGRDRSPKLSRDRSPRLGRDRSPRLGRDRSPSWDRSPRFRHRISASPPYWRKRSRSRSKERKTESIQQTLSRLAGIEYHEPKTRSPVDSPIEGFRKSLADSTISDEQLLQNQEQQYSGSPAYYNNTAPSFKSETGSPKRLSLDDRINQVLGLEKDEPKPISTTYSQNYGYENHAYYDQYGPYNQSYQSNKGYGNYPQTDEGVQGVKNKVVQVGNMLQIVPTEEVNTAALPPRPAEPPQKVVQVGNMLQIVPTSSLPPPPSSKPQSEQLAQQAKEKQSAEELMKQKIAERKAEREKRRMEREKRRKEKEKKQKEREKRRQLKLKQKTEDMIKKALEFETEENDDYNRAGVKSKNIKVQGQPTTKKPLATFSYLPNNNLENSIEKALELEAEENDDYNEEVVDTQEIKVWPAVPAILSTPTSRSSGKGILISNRMRTKDRPKKGVKFADGVIPGEGTSPSAGEELSSPPPITMVREKRFTKTKKPKKVKLPKKKVKVKIIRKSSRTVDADNDEEEDNLPPPSPPPGSPPIHLFPPRIKPAIPNNLAAPSFLNTPPPHTPTSVSYHQTQQFVPAPAPNYAHPPPINIPPPNMVQHMPPMMRLPPPPPPHVNHHQPPPIQVPSHPPPPPPQHFSTPPPTHHHHIPPHQLVPGIPQGGPMRQLPGKVAFNNSISPPQHAPVHHHGPHH